MLAGATAVIPTTPAPVDSESRVGGLASVVYTAPFVWPAEGPITSLMGPEHPDGIDIGLDVVESLEIRASAGGTVVTAGGSDEEPLGISVVIDHGNGVTTTYGHLAELLVEEGQAVAAGEVIGTGGSTGDSTAPHLHFEVRKDGATVDPLDVLLEERVDSRLSAVDCESSAIVLPLGAHATVDFEGLVDAGSKIESVRALTMTDGPTLGVSIAGRSAIGLSSAIDFDASDGEDEYKLAVTLDRSAEHRVLSCPLVVQRKSVPTTFYVRATEEGEPDTAAEEVEVAPTPTESPWPSSPSYGVPASSGAGVQSPAYSAPSGSGIQVQSPSYGFPSGTPAPEAR